jgi:hypothetical protein
MIRAFGGNNDHPDPHIFLLIFRLMAVYSLVKPDGSNVTGQELFDVLISVDEDGTAGISENVTKWKNIREQITSNTLFSIDTADSADYFLDESFEVDEPEDISKVDDGELRENEQLLQFFAGYVASKAAKFKACNDCIPHLYSRANTCNLPATFLDMRNYFNVLHYPTETLFSLVKILEKSILSVITSTEKLSPDTFFEIARSLLNLDLPHVGCAQHKPEVTGYIIQFYLVLRMHFASQEFNNTISNRKKSTELRKMGKLVAGT